MDYFGIGNGTLQSKSILKYCEKYPVPNQNGNGHGFEIQPVVVNKICEILCNNNHMSCIRTDGKLGIGNSYIVAIQNS